jgi:predicted HicB family RNase H-like nuclease
MVKKNKESLLKYKDYSAVIEFDSIHKLFHGEVIGLKDVITFLWNFKFKNG